MQVGAIHQFRINHSAELLSHNNSSINSTDPAESSKFRLSNQIFLGQIVRIRSRYTNLSFIDLRLAPIPASSTRSTATFSEESNASAEICPCCSKLTVFIHAQNLPSKTCTSYKKGKIKLGDVIQVTGDLVFADVSTGWVDKDPLTGTDLLEARIIATTECVLIEKYRGRGFEAEMPVFERSKGDLKVQKVCKFWINTGGKCPVGQKCPFKHVDRDQISEIRKAWVSDRISKRMENATFDWHDPTPMALKAPHAMRASVFADWIIETFGPLDRLNSGSGVFDIAGGSGQLSVELFERGVKKCTVIDSRSLRMGFALKRWIKKQKQKDSSSVVNEFPDYEDEDLEHDGHEYHQDNQFQNYTPDSEQETVSISELNLPFTYLQSFFDEENAPIQVKNASLLIGLHPDQATGSIVDVALKHNMRFAVIPCCVFKDEFSERKLLSGNPVATTVELVEWIKEKRDPGVIETEFLGFQGKNLVVFSRR